MEQLIDTIRCAFAENPQAHYRISRRVLAAALPLPPTPGAVQLESNIQDMLAGGPQRHYPRALEETFGELCQREGWAYWYRIETGEYDIYRKGT